MTLGTAVRSSLHSLTLVWNDINKKMTIKTKLNEKETPKDQKECTMVRIFVQQMLKTRIFTGSYIGRFYVESLKDYRDVIKIYKEEKDFIKDIKIVKRRMDNFYHGNMWTAITGPGSIEIPSGHCMWVQLKNVAFGNYWFMIEEVSFSDKELVIEVKVVRHFEADISSTSLEDGSEFWNTIRNNMYNGVQKTITLHNMKESAKFLFALIMTIATVILYGLQYLGDYSIKFFKEFNNLIKVCTPLLLGILDLISKTIGGFYILIAMLWRGHGPVRPPLQSLMALPGQGQHQFRPTKPIPYRRKQYEYYQ